MPYLQDWTGRTETRHDQVTPWPIAALAATLDRNDPHPQTGDPLPPLWHWLYFLSTDRQSQLGRDGHAERGAFLPPVELPRRMWAGGRFEFHHPLRVGDQITRVSTIKEIREKQGRSGPLVFVVVRHEVSNHAGVALTEEHEIVYREVPKADEPTPPLQSAPTSAAWQRTIQPDDVLLFRYSALTFNGHRIHYDRRHTTEVEGYPGLIVHGPLIATLLLDLLQREMPAATVASFHFRAMAPLFDTAPFQICGQPSTSGQQVNLWAQDAAGGLAISAEAKLVSR
ncbi:MAG: MaoC family dehydratase N-terminal domain-containing protein [Acidobacteriota bacterium]